jgi:hypothetical protein
LQSFDHTVQTLATSGDLKLQSAASLQPRTA